MTTRLEPGVLYILCHGTPGWTISSQHMEWLDCIGIPVHDMQLTRT